MIGSVEVLHVRDPDGGCYITVFIDGEPYEAQEETVDAGRGYTREDWDESTASIVRLIADGRYSPAFGNAVLEARDEPAGSKYIED